MEYGTISREMIKNGFDLQSAKIRDVEILVGNMIQLAVENNDKKLMAHKTIVVTPFNSKSIPKISIQEYLNRLINGADILGIDVILSLLIYFIRIGTIVSKINKVNTVDSSCCYPIDYPNRINCSLKPLSSIRKSLLSLNDCCGERKCFCKDDGYGTKGTNIYCGFYLNSYNIHRMIITSLVIGHKLCSDIFYSNERYGKIGGISTHELNMLEMEILFLIKFDLVVRPREMQKMGETLLSQYVAQRTPQLVKSIKSYKQNIIEQFKAKKAVSVEQNQADSVESSLYRTDSKNPENRLEYNYAGSEREIAQKNSKLVRVDSLLDKIKKNSEYKKEKFY
ncbi:hypothetical protein BB559_006859 [Furculomyces boomerangus]|uniref:Cyclin n=2 Tax=Harpellales TaxID=61421 RepID=A0A2T9Y037_9FUNG|nr:hypothetical protein BB559_006859 [Furculomyces boomerangus]PVZ96987.1 hypothetical protein BB558_007077 [Smittium angustum]